MRLFERFDDRTLWNGALLTATATVAMVVAGLALAVARVTRDGLAASWVVQNAFGALVFCPVFLLTARAQPRNRVVWAVGASMLLSGVQVLSGALALIWITDAVGSYASDFVPADIGLAAAIANWVQAWTWVPIVVLLGPVLLLWFPDGALPSRRWRLVMWTAVAAMSAIMVASMMVAWPTSLSSQPTPDTGLAALLLAVGYPLIAVATVLAFASVVVRARTADGVVRQQIRTLGFGAVVFGLVTGVSLSIDPTSALFQITAIPGMVVLGAAFAIAIGRYRMFDIDVVINRTLVFGVLAVFITGVYAAIVVGVGSLVGHPSNPVLAIAATALVALIFEPVRARVQHWANVVAYGRRATPYEVLAGFADQLRQPAVEPDEQVGELARLLADGTGARRATVWLAVDGRLRPVATAPADAPPPPGEQIDDVMVDVAVPVTLDGDVLGALGIDARRGSEVTSLDRRVLRELAGQAALVLGNARLRARLRQRLAALTESRRRLVVATDEERRRLERDLHDGAQQQLVAIKVKLGLARTLARREDVDQLAVVLEGVGGEADAAVDSLRELARGIYPPLLESEGLAVTLEAQARKTPLPVTLDADGVGRHPRDVEVCMYVCVVQALANVVRHADATSATVTLSQDRGVLSFAVSDDGVGFDPGVTAHGSGLLGMADRLDTVGGRLDIASAPGCGTTVGGRMPVPAVTAQAPA